MAKKSSFKVNYCPTKDCNFGSVFSREDFENIQAGSRQEVYS